MKQGYRTVKIALRHFVTRCIEVDCTQLIAVLTRIFMWRRVLDRHRPDMADMHAPAENSLTISVVLDSRQTIEVRILRPKRRAMSLRGCEHYAVRHRYPVQGREPRGFYGRRPVKIYDAPLFHNGDGSQRVVLTALLANPLEHLKQ
jgi:hypothetical protein